VLAALYYWTPKMTGRLMNETLGKISFWISFAGFNVAFFTMHILGVQGMPRRIYTYPAGLGWTVMNQIVTIAAFVLAVGILLTFINFFWSRKHGKYAGKNPWNSDSMEWSTDSPPPPYGSEHIPTIRTRHPLWDEHDEEEDPDGARILDQGRLTFATTWLDAEPFAVAAMPENTILPLFLAIGFLMLFLALTFQWLWFALGALLFSLGTAAIWMWPQNNAKVI
jgi:heme/copper-type cytochrome/quinol oxidase subunit 1